MAGHSPPAAALGTAVTVIDFKAFIGRLATSSGETILPFFRTSLSIDNKSVIQDFDPVTEADRAAEAVMRRLVCSLRTRVMYALH